MEVACGLQFWLGGDLENLALVNFLSLNIALDSYPATCCAGPGIDHGISCLCHSARTEMLAKGTTASIEPPFVNTNVQADKLKTRSSYR